MACDYEGDALLLAKAAKIVCRISLATMASILIMHLLLLNLDIPLIGNPTAIVHWNEDSSETRSKNIITHLNDLGLSVSYDRVL